MSAVIAYLIVGLISFAGIWAEIVLVDGHRHRIDDVVAVPVGCAAVALFWLPLFVWAFTGGKRRRLEARA